MLISKSILNIRFGYGLAPDIAPMSSISWVLSDLIKPDNLQKKFTRPSFKQRLNLFEKLKKARKDERQNKSNAMQNVKALRKTAQEWVAKDMRAFMLKAALSENGFRERLVAFWADHFTVSGKNLELMLAYVHILMKLFE